MSADEVSFRELRVIAQRSRQRSGVPSQAVGEAAVLIAATQSNGGAGAGAGSRGACASSHERGRRIRLSCVAARCRARPDSAALLRLVAADEEGVAASVDGAHSAGCHTLRRPHHRGRVRLRTGLRCGQPQRSPAHAAGIRWRALRLPVPPRATSGNATPTPHLNVLATPGKCWTSTVWWLRPVPAAH